MTSVFQKHNRVIARDMIQRLPCFIHEFIQNDNERVIARPLTLMGYIHRQGDWLSLGDEAIIKLHRPTRAGFFTGGVNQGGWGAYATHFGSTQT